MLLASATLSQNILTLVPHRPKQDPRLSWMALGASGPLCVHQLGVHTVESNPLVESAQDARGAWVVSVPAEAYRPGEAVLWAARCKGHAGAQTAAGQLLWMERALTLPDAAFLSAIGAARMCERVLALRELFRYFLNIAASLIRQGSRFRGVDCIVAADLPALPAALILGASYEARVVFDAHEYWPEADLSAAKFEVQFWMDLERLLLPHADARFTVSNGLAQHMARAYELSVAVLPNAEPLKSLVAQSQSGQTADCVFLFQGVFASGRGIECLIEIWPLVSQSSHLMLRGPLGDQRDRMMALADATGLLGKRIFFPLPVDESELVEAASCAQVGLIPYEPHGANHRHCCPNKMSQYMAAGLPILANDTSYVGEVVREANAGLVVDFSNRQALVQAINRLTSDPDGRKQFSMHSARYFSSTFHWEAVSLDFYKELSRLLDGRPHRRLEWFEPGHGLTDDVDLGGPTVAEQARNLLSSALLQAGRALWVRLPASLQRQFKPLAEKIWRRLRGV